VRWAVSWLMFTSFMLIYCKMSTPHAYTNLSQIAQHMWKFELASLGHFNYHSFTVHNQCRTRVTGLILKSQYTPLCPRASGFRLPYLYLVKPCQTLIWMMKLRCTKWDDGWD
jgi:hypothetical protein